MYYSEISDEIVEIVKREESLLKSLSIDEITVRVNSQRRTIKMLVGHMIDSASNNHQRMVRLQYVTDGELVFPDYTQDNNLWIRLQKYQEEDWTVLIQLWMYSNIHIAYVIRTVDHSKLNNFWTDYQGNRVTLDMMIRGYLDHLKLHVSHIHELLSKD